MHKLIVISRDIFTIGKLKALVSELNPSIELKFYKNLLDLKSKFSVEENKSTSVIVAYDLSGKLDISTKENIVDMATWCKNISDNIKTSIFFSHVEIEVKEFANELMIDYVYPRSKFFTANILEKIVFKTS
jgi:hypothetical protein